MGMGRRIGLEAYRCCRAGRTACCVAGAPACTPHLTAALLGAPNQHSSESRLRTGMCLATSDHLLPTRLCHSASSASSSSVHTPGCNRRTGGGGFMLHRGARLWRASKGMGVEMGGPGQWGTRGQGTAAELGTTERAGSSRDAAGQDPLEQGVKHAWILQSKKAGRPREARKSTGGARVRARWREPWGRERCGRQRALRAVQRQYSTCFSVQRCADGPLGAPLGMWGGSQEHAPSSPGRRSWPHSLIWAARRRWWSLGRQGGRNAGARAF